MVFLENKPMPCIIGLAGWISVSPSGIQISQAVVRLGAELPLRLASHSHAMPSDAGSSPQGPHACFFPRPCARIWAWKWPVGRALRAQVDGKLESDRFSIWHPVGLRHCSIEKCSSIPLAHCRIIQDIYTVQKRLSRHLS